MFRKTTLSLLAAASLSVSFAQIANAHEAGDFIMRAGMVAVDPQESSSNLAVDGVKLDGYKVGLDSSKQLGLTVSYLFTDHIAIGVLAATPFKHRINGAGSALAGAGKLGETKHLPPTVTVQYFPMDRNSPFQPYVGAGVNYTNFFSEKTTGTLTDALGTASSKLKLDDSIGLAAEVGIDYMLSENIGVNAAIWWADIDTEGTIKTYDAAGNRGPTGKIDVDIDPFVYMVGLSYKF